LATLKDISRAAFEEAVRIYLDEVYGPSDPPERVQARLQWPAGETLAEIAAGEVFERAPADVPPEDCRAIRLRLGNPRYPHMKLGLDRVPGTGDWVLTVDCHDRVLVSAASEAEQAVVRELVQCNAAFKGRIERRWAEAGLPTFGRFVRDQLAARKADDESREA